MSLASCSNFGSCKYAGEPKWDAQTVVCPNCGMSLASPHVVTLTPAPNYLSENKPFSLLAKIEKISGCARPVRVSLLIDGLKPIDPDPPEDPSDSKAEFKDIPGLPRGLYRCRAILLTSDGRSTNSNEDLLYFAQPPDVFSLWVWALLLMLVLCLGVGLAWIGDPVFGRSTAPWLPIIKDILSLIVPMLIGCLFLDLGTRDLRSEQARRLPGSESDLRSLILPDRVAETFPRAAKLATQHGPRLGIVLIILGALPIGFVAARLTALGPRPLNGAIPSLIAFVLAVGLILFTTWPRDGSAAQSPRSNDTADSAQLAQADTTTTVAEQPQVSGDAGEKHE